jgi:hypothetical protein
LGSVKTGGFEQARLRAAQIFGIEGGDEGELSNLMGKAVLGQLKDIFGSAFTVGEGDRLERMEAGFGKSAKANRRLLDNALALTKRSVKRGIRAAKRAGQDEEAADLQELLDATLETPATQKSLPQGITEDDITETMSANNMTREEVLKRLNQ